MTPQVRKKSYLGVLSVRVWWLRNFRLALIFSIGKGLLRF